MKLSDVAQLQANLAKGKAPTEDQALLKLEAAVQRNPNSAAANLALNTLRKNLGIPSNPPSLAAPAPKGEPERAEQVALAARLDALFPPRSWFHVPNERSSKRQAGRLQEEGVKSGVPDVLVILRTPAGLPGVAVEMKSPKEKTGSNSFSGTSENQRGWLWALSSQGWRVCVAYSADEAFDFIYGIYFGGAP